MTSHCTAEFFRANRDRLRTQYGGDSLIVITANGQLQKSMDTAYEFTQDSNFWYLTGLDNPDLLLVMGQGQEYVIVPELSDSKIFFDGAIVADELRQKSGIHTILNRTEGMRLLKSHVQKTHTIAVLEPAPEYVDQLGMYTNPARARLVRDLKKLNRKAELHDVRGHLARMRMVKQAPELAALQNAIDITCRGVEQARDEYLGGQFASERDAELFLRSRFYRDGGEGHGFDPIVAAGANACTIHPVVSDQPIGDLPLLVDVGASAGMYKADISRSWSRRPSKRYKAVLQAVKNVSDYAMSQLKPGVTIRDYEKAVVRRMGRELKQLGLITTASNSNIRTYFPHATSHFLGIDVHDVGVYDEPLPAGAVLTVEPGIYIKDEGIGVRIENDVLITEDGCKNLSASLADLQPNM